MIPLRILAALTLLWAAAALCAQVLLVYRGGRRDYSLRAGSPARGLIHNFTSAMLPGHKESVRLHPAEFAAGIALHLGVFAALAEVLVLLANGAVPERFGGLRVIAAVGLPAGIALLVRRVRSPLLRRLSAPDDYVAVLATVGLLGFATLPFPGPNSPAWLLGYAVPFFLYLPLGKLRHAVFFFVARAELGRRLGYRGVYPPASAR